MKTIEEIIASEPIFLNDWKDGELIQLISDFESVYISKEEYEAEKCPYNNIEAWERRKIEMKNLLEGYYSTIKILFASYTYEDYSGDAFVLFAKDGKLYEVNGGHCSCYGLEGQWEGDAEVYLEELKNRLEKGSFGYYDRYQAKLKEFLGL